MTNMFATSWFTVVVALAALGVQETLTPIAPPAAESGAQRAAPVVAPAPQGTVAGPEVAATADALPAAEPVAEPSGALTVLVQLLERNEVQRAYELARVLTDGLARSDGDAAVLASRAVWSAEQRAHLAYCGGLAEARFAAAQLALALNATATDGAPDESAVRALEDASAASFARAASAAGPGELRDRALAAPGVVLAWRGEREVRAAHSQAMLQRSPVPFGKDTPEREALLAARATLVDARAALVVRLEHDWRDVDNRANLEWVVRRLFEIDRVIERADEQDEENEQQQQNDEEQEGDGGEQGENGDQQDPSEQNGEGDEEQEGGEQAGDQGEDGEPQDDGNESENGSQNDQEGEAGDPQDSAITERNTEAPSGDGSRPADADAPFLPATLGDVEVQRLLNRLADIEKDAEQLRRRLRATERRRVEKDW